MYNNRNKFNRNNNRFGGNNCVKFRNNEKDILPTKPKSVLTSRNSFEFDRFELVYSKKFWHQIVVHKDNCNKTEVEAALISAIDDQFFIPIAYRVGVTQDTFYIYDQGNALEELLKQSLAIDVGGTQRISLTVNLGVAPYEEGQIDPMKIIEDAVESRLKKMQGYKLDLSNFKTCQEFFDIKFWIGSEANFSALCNAFMKVLSSEYFKTAKCKITQIDLSNNGLKKLSPLLILEGFDGVESLILEKNSINDVNEIENLKNFKLKNLALFDNPIAADQENLHNILISTLPNLINCDIPQPIQEVPLKKRKLSTYEDSSISTEEGGNIVTISDINGEFKKNFQNLEIIKTLWSKVYIEHNGIVSSEEILSEMFQQFFMHTFCYPCYYRVGQNEDFFYLYRNFDAIKILVDNNLRLTVNGTMINFRLHLRCADYQQGQVKFYQDLPKVILSRVTGSRVDLRNLQHDPRLKNLIVNMSTVIGLKFVMDCMCQLQNKTEIVEIDLSGNGIIHLNILKDLTKFPNLKVLNLSNNEIDSFTGFPTGLKIVVLTLDHNPLCSKYYRQPYKYVSALTQRCGQLEYLDGLKIDANLKTVNLKNFYCTSKAFNAVENFVEFFVKSLEAKRSNLANVYTKNSMYTERYGKDGCVKKFRDISSIMSHITRIPPVVHDLINTSIDVPLFNDQHIHIIMSGILKINNKLYTYTRSLMMARGDRAVGTLSNTFYFYIANEIFQFDDICDDKIRNRAFKQKQATLDDFKKAYEGLFTKEEEMNAKISLLKQITMLKLKWCKRFIEDANGNLNDAIEYFSNFYTERILKAEDFDMH